MNPYREILIKSGQKLFQPLKECVKLTGMSEYFLRGLVTKNKVRSNRIGSGKNARYQVDVADLLQYLDTIK